MPLVAVDWLADLGQVAPCLEERRFGKVGKQRRAADLHRRVVAPLFRVADLVVDLPQLLAGGRPRRLVHPADGCEVALERALDSLDHLLGDLLSLLADGGDHEGASQRLAQRAIGHLHAPLPARQDGLGAGERLRQPEALLDESLSERRRRVLHRGPAKVRLDVVELPLRRQQLVHAGEEVRREYVDGLHGGGAQLVEVRVPEEVRRNFLQAGPLEAVVDFIGIAPLHLVHRRLRERRLDLHHGPGLFLRLRLGGARERQHLLDVVVIERAQLAHALVVLQVVIAVRQAQPTLVGAADDQPGVLEILLRSESEQRAPPDGLQARDRPG